MKGTKTITLHLTPDVLGALRMSVSIRHLADRPGGVPDALVEGIIEKIEAGEAEWTPRRRK